MLHESLTMKWTMCGLSIHISRHYIQSPLHTESFTPKALTEYNSKVSFGCGSEEFA